MVNWTSYKTKSIGKILYFVLLLFESLVFVGLIIITFEHNILIEHSSNARLNNTKLKIKKCSSWRDLNSNLRIPFFMDAVLIMCNLFSFPKLRWDSLTQTTALWYKVQTGWVNWLILSVWQPIYGYFISTS